MGKRGDCRVKSKRTTQFTMQTGICDQNLNRFGKSGDFAVIISPTDQGYFEADTSALLRLKVQSEYGYGSTPGTILTDKVNLLGSGAHPFWRWLEGSCRTPQGLGKVQVRKFN